MSIKKIAVSAALVAALASKGEAKVNMTKQQAISLKLAQWLGYDARVGEDCVGYYLCFDGDKTFVHFNPFSATTEGRAQFAECVIKVNMTVLSLKLPVPGESVTEYVSERLEAIYYAIGGTAEAKPS